MFGFKRNELATKILKEEARIAKRIDELRGENEKDQAILSGHEAAFREATFNGADEKTISGLIKKRDEAAQRINQRNESLKALSTQSVKENPSIQALLFESLDGNLKDIENARNQALSIQNGLWANHQALLDGLKKMDELREELHKNRRAVNEYHSRLSDENREQLGIPDVGLPNPTRTQLDPIAGLMKELLIESHVIRGGFTFGGSEDE